MNTMQEIRLQARQKLVAALWQADTPDTDIVLLAQAAGLDDAQVDTLAAEIAAARAAKPLADDLPRLRREHSKAAADAAKAATTQQAVIDRAQAVIDAARAVARQTAARVAEAEEAYDAALAPLAWRGDVPPALLPGEFFRRKEAETAEQERLAAHKAYYDTERAVAAIRDAIESVQRRIDARDTREADGISTTTAELQKRLDRLNKDLTEANKDLKEAAIAAKAAGIEIVE